MVHVTMHEEKINDRVMRILKPGLLPILSNSSFLEVLEMRVAKWGLKMPIGRRINYVHIRRESCLCGIVSSSIYDDVHSSLKVQSVLLPLHLLMRPLNHLRDTRMHFDLDRLIIIVVDRACRWQWRDCRTGWSRRLQWWWGCRWWWWS